MPLKTDNLNSSQEGIKKERTDAKKLYSNLHTYAMVYTHTYAHNNNNNDNDQNNIHYHMLK